MVTAGAVFVVLAVWDLKRRWQPGELVISPLLVALSFVPVLAGTITQGFGWLALLAAMTGRRSPTLPGMVLFLDSQLGRYMPGKVGLPVVRMAGADRVRAPVATVGISVFIEMLSWLAVGCVMGFAFLYATNTHAAGVLALVGRFGLPLLGASVAGLIALLVVDRRHLPAKIRERFAVGDRGPLVPPVLPCYHLVYWGNWALHGYLVTWAVTGLAGPATASPGLFILGSVLGFLAAFAPAGLGIREAVFAAGLAPVIGSAPAVAAAILSRALSITADVVAWALARMARGIQAQAS
ncbi:MAG: flippase-like domain-containing protein [Polyangiaceae bacterium]|nr:flippase-like domain-containing protein [Polyangiaceae bacterium]